jgi:hypothetical protein
MADLSEYVTLAEAVEDLEIDYTPYWISKLIQRGKVEGKKLGPRNRGTWLVHLPSLKVYVAEMKKLGPRKHGVQ